LKRNGKVFLDFADKPFYITTIGGKEWLCHWHITNQWVMLREVKEGEWFPDNLSHDEQELYFPDSSDSFDTMTEITGEINH